MAEEALRRNLDRAFDPGAEFPSRLLVSRTMAAVSDEVRGAGRGGNRRPRRRWLHLTPSDRILRFVAGVVALLLVVVAAAAFLALHGLFTPAPVHGPGPRVLPTRSFQVRTPGTAVCSSRDCDVESPEFVSPSVGWLTEGSISSPDCARDCPTTLFRTVDGGAHWKAVLTWAGGVEQILGTGDGREVTVVVGWDSSKAGVLHSVDGGVHWTSSAYPPDAGKASDQICKPDMPCLRQSIPYQVYFANPREGWVLSQEPTYSVADLFRTTDSGQHWTLTRVDIKSAFGLDLANGLTYGQLIFGNSSTGWFVPQERSEIFVTHDGGSTWRAQSIPGPAGIAPDAKLVIDSVRLFSNGRDGVLSEYALKPGDPRFAPYPAKSTPFQFIFTTADGGDHWSLPYHPSSVDLSANGTSPGGVFFVGVSLDFVDATHWMGWPETAGWPTPVVGFMRTTDAGQSWDVFPAPQYDFNNYQPLFGFSDPAAGWAFVGAGGGGGISELPYASGVSLYRTRDGGRTWRAVALPEVQ